MAKRRKKGGASTSSVVTNVLKKQSIATTNSIVEKHERSVSIKNGEASVDLDRIIPPGLESTIETILGEPGFFDRERQSMQFGVGGTYEMLTNVDQKTFDDIFCNQAIRNVIIETVGANMPEGCSVVIESLDTARNVITYKIAQQSEIPSSKPPSSTSSAVVGSIVEVESLQMGNDESIGCHPSTRGYFRQCSKQLVKVLHYFKVIATDIDNAPRVGDDGVNLDAWGIYQRLVIDDLDQSIEVDKSGFTKDFLERFKFYRVKNPNTVLAIKCDLSKMDYTPDIACRLIVEEMVKDIAADHKVPAPIKHLVCEVFFCQGGLRFGGMDVFMGKLIEAGIQNENSESIILEMGQYSDSLSYCMRGKVLETDCVTAPIVTSFGKLPCDCRSSWAPAPHPKPERDDQIFLTPTALNFCGTPHELSKDAYEGPAIPGSKKADDRWSTAYAPRQHLAAQARIRDTITAGGFTLLDSNKLNEEKCHWSISNDLVDAGYSSKVELYSNEILLYVNTAKRSVKAVHSPPCIAGDIREFFSLNKLGQGCINIQTSHNLVSRAKGLPIDLAMHAIEAHMAQRNIICGLGQSRFMRGLFLRHYLAPSEGAFDRYGGNSHGRITHYPLYPIAQKNKTEYRTKRM